MLAALYHRDRTGQGQFVDASAREAIAMHMGEQFAAVAATGSDPPRHGNDHSSYAPHDVYACGPEDDPEWVAIVCRDDHEWGAFCTATGLSALRDDPRYRTGLRRWKRREELNRVVESWTRERSAREAADTLLAAGVPASPTLSGHTLYDDPHFQARLNSVAVSPPEMDERYVLAPPWRLSLTPPAIAEPAPTLGQHSRWVLEELLGYDPERVDALDEAGVLT